MNSVVIFILLCYDFKLLLHFYLLTLNQNIHKKYTLNYYQHMHIKEVQQHKDMRTKYSQFFYKI